MDLNTVTSVLRPAQRQEITGWQAGDAVLGGGTWLFSEPQPGVRRLVDLDGFGWDPLRADANGLHIAATCKIARLAAFEAPPAWRAAPLIGLCCNALLGSFKIWNMATVGGNICLALPAGPMTALAAAMDGMCTIWSPDGTERTVRVTDFVEAPQRCALMQGELLRSVHLPAAALSRLFAFRRISLSEHGRSAALLIGTRAADAFSLTITASTPRPVRLDYTSMPDEPTLRLAIEGAIPTFYDDVHGHPDWRRHVTLDFAEAIRRELDA